MTTNPKAFLVSVDDSIDEKDVINHTEAYLMAFEDSFLSKAKKFRVYVTVEEVVGS